MIIFTKSSNKLKYSPKYIIMKKLLFLSIALLFSAGIYAQDSKAEKARQDAKKTAGKVAVESEKAAEKTGNAIERTATKVDDKARKVHNQKVQASKEVRKDVDRTAAKVENKAAKAADKK
jgi:hypothetical protein